MAGAKPGYSWKAPQLLKPLVTALKTVLELPQIIQESSTAGSCTGFILLRKLLPGAHPALLAAAAPLQGLKVLGSASSPWPSPGMLLSHIKLSPAFFLKSPWLFSSPAIPKQGQGTLNLHLVFSGCWVPKPSWGRGSWACASWEMLVTHG